MLEGTRLLEEMRPVRHERERGFQVGSSAATATCKSLSPARECDD